MFSEVWHRRIFLFGIITMACGLLFGPVLISVPQVILGANWFLEKNYTHKIKSLYKNKFFWVLCSLFFVHLLGLIYTNDLASGMGDIKTKVPLLVLAIIFLSTKPLNKNELNLLLKFFFASVIISSFYCYLVLLGVTHKTIIDVRDASVFMSHIRFSLIISLTIISITYFLRLKINLAIGIPAILWLVFFMLKFQMATGIVLLALVSVIILLFYAFKKLNIYLNLSIYLILILVLFFSFQKINSDLSMYNKYPSKTENILRKQTANQNPYLQDTLFNLAENGNLITINICDKELRKEWLNRSNLNFEENDKSLNNLRFTILRYMSSKGLSKDSAGLAKLSNQDIINIENGFSNYKYTLNSGLQHKWREIVWEYTKYKRHENPSGHTLSMRIEFWKTAIYAIKQNILFGVGTGDVQQSLNKAYTETNSKLSNEWRLRCHNQYFAFTLAFGLIGFIIFTFYILYPIFILRKELHPLFWPFILIILFSFFTEDTLENQAGLNFFAIFYTLFIWLASSSKKKNSDLKF